MGQIGIQNYAVTLKKKWSIKVFFETRKRVHLRKLFPSRNSLLQTTFVSDISLYLKRLIELFMWLAVEDSSSIIFPKFHSFDCEAN